VDDCGIDFAVGCSYKYLNGGPGAPGFIYVAARHQAKTGQPLCGWWSHASPFGFTPEFRPAPGIRRFLTGTQPILSLVGIQAGLETFRGVALGELRTKSMALCQLFADLVRQECDFPAINIQGGSPWSSRGSHVCVSFPRAYALMQALIDRGVIGDFRAPDLMRFGFAPLYVGYHDVWLAVQTMKRCLSERHYEDPGYNRVAPVT
jgi:kynureninase